MTFDNLSNGEKAVLAGGLAGSTAKTVTAPLSRLTILFQIHSVLSPTKYGKPKIFANSLWAACKKVLKEDGFKGFWKGNGMSIIHRFPYSAINFSGYELSRNIARKTLSIEESPTVRLICGAFAGAIACTACYPLDLLRTRLSISTQSLPGSTGVIQASLRIYSEEGWLGFYRGLNASLLSCVPSLAISYSCYGSLKDLLLHTSFHWPEDFSVSHKNSNKLTPLGSLVCGSISGVTASLITFPADVLRRRLQVRGLLQSSVSVSSSQHHHPHHHTHPHQQTKKILMNTTTVLTLPNTTNIPNKNSIANEFSLIIRSSGIRGLYHGIVPELLKITPMVSITFCTYEMLADILDLKGHL